MATKNDTVTAGQANDATAKKVFELFVETLEGERDTADEDLLTRLRWFSEDVSSAAERLSKEPRAAWPLVHTLGDTLLNLARKAEAVAVMEENVHQARRWALLLPEVSIHE